MKSLALFCCLFAAASALSYDKLLLREWDLYKSEYGKVYENSDEDLHRMKIYLESKKEIAEHNLKYSRGEVSYEIGVNQFSDMLSEEVDAMFFSESAFYQDEYYLDNLVKDEFVPSGREVPEHVDWREKGAVTPVRSQNNCGSCYAFAAVATVESRAHIYKKDKLQWLSVQQVVDCSYNVGNSGCSGGLAMMSLEYIKAEGLVNETNYPYVQKETTCKFDKGNVVARISGYQRTKSLNATDLKLAIAEGPVVVSVYSSPSSFKKYKGGVYDDPECIDLKLNHAVTAVGYGTDPVTKKDYWLIKNSWNTTWGEQGYMKLVRNEYNACGVLSRPVLPTI